MDRQFPQIKSTSILPHHSSKLTTQKIIKRATQGNVITQNNKCSLNFINTSRLPPINSSMELPIVSSLMQDPFQPAIHSRRAISHHYLSDTRKTVNRYIVKTKTGSVMGCPKPQNQDSYILHPVLPSPNLHFFAVCDGHGSDGHLVSGMVKSQFTGVLEKHLNKTEASLALTRAVNEINHRVLSSKLDTNFSGSTFVGVLIQGDTIFCANVGDSAAVIGSYLSHWRAVKLTEDHSPGRQDEAQRVLSKGGRICSHAQGGPLRIWFRDQNIPGLAMTRSIGDKASRSIGLISDPEISSHKIQPSDKFVIIASDGLWEFVSEIEAVNLVAELMAQGKEDLACSKLIRESEFRWNAKGMSVDDITIIIVFLV